MVSLAFQARPQSSLVLFAAALGLLSACSSAGTPASAQLHVDYDILDNLPEAPLNFVENIQPILNSRCVVCHGCYDAPCQLKLNSAAGIARGAHKDRVYDGARIVPADPTRLFIDALTTDGWRDKGFYPVVNEDDDDPEENLEASVTYRMLRLKQRNPQPLIGKLDPSIDTGLNRKQSCPKIDEFPKYAKKHPGQGMPFALPNLKAREYQALVQWLAQGAHVPPPPPNSAIAQVQIDTWEAFLNQEGPKMQLVSRYIYEHLVMAHLYFVGTKARTFFRLVRSKTPPGEPTTPVATRRPYGNPEGPVYYRIERLVSSVVAKDHIIYELSEQRMARYRELFLEPDYEVTEMPSYGPRTASNPFKAFAAIPLRSRYEFLLDEARFFIEGFIKGPVCRGQIALNVIEDRFWVFFVDPEAPLASNSDSINKFAEFLAMPTEQENTFNVVTTQRHYLGLENEYLEARHKSLEATPVVRLEQAKHMLWNGGGTNKNASLTIFRHFDSASVDFGLRGSEPETAWVIDYPILERIHYLLVAGFDEYGNIGHQLNTRLYMDILRMEAENNLLLMLPKKARQETHRAWYSGIRSDDEKDVWVWQMQDELVNGYKTDDHWHELIETITDYLGPIAKPVRPRPCADANVNCNSKTREDDILLADSAMGELVKMSGKVMDSLPDIAFVRVRLGGDARNDLAYSLISDKSYHNVSLMVGKWPLDGRRDHSKDKQTVLPWIEGTYPNFFYVVDLKNVQRFAAQYAAIDSARDHERFIATFGVRRTNPEFWETADWFNAQALREQPLRGGILDFNRYLNR